MQLQMVCKLELLENRDQYMKFYITVVKEQSLLMLVVMDSLLEQILFQNTLRFPQTKTYINENFKNNA